MIKKVNMGSGEAHWSACVAEAVVRAGQRPGDVVAVLAVRWAGNLAEEGGRCC